MLFRSKAFLVVWDMETFLFFYLADILVKENAFPLTNKQLKVTIKDVDTATLLARDLSQDI